MQQHVRLLLGGTLALLVLSMAWAGPQSGGLALPTAEEMLVYLEGKVMQSTHINQAQSSHLAALAPPKRIAGMVRSIIEQHSTGVLFTPDMRHGGPGDLWLFDRTTGGSRKLSEQAVGSFSPDGSLLSVSNDRHEHYIMTREGKVLHRIGGHGSVGKFSPDGTKVAYMRLTDDPAALAMGSPSLFQGLAIYDLVSGEDDLLLESAGDVMLPSGHLSSNADYGVLGWHPGGERIYIASHRNDVLPGEGAVWSVRSDGTDRRQETNKAPSEPRLTSFGHTLLWSPDGALAIGGSVHAFWFGRDGELLEVEKLADAEPLRGSLQWVRTGETVAFLQTRTGGATWAIVRLDDIKAAKTAQGRVRLGDIVERNR